MPAVRLVGQRVVLAPLRLGDGRSLTPILRDPQAARYLPPRVRHEGGVRFARRVVREKAAGRGAPFVILDAAHGRVVGQVRLIRESKTDPSAELGIWVRRSSWGHGYGTEAVELLCTYGFRALRLHRISASVVEGNRRSTRLLSAVGFHREERRREAARVGRRWADVWVFGLLAQDWRGTVRAGRRAGRRVRPS